MKARQPKQPAVCGRCGNSGIVQRHPFIQACDCGAVGAAADGCQKPPAAEREAFAAAAGYAALREDIERRLSEARLRAAAYGAERSERLRAHWFGRVAALTVLLQDDERRKEAPHSDEAHGRGEETP